MGQIRDDEHLIRAYPARPSEYFFLKNFQLSRCKFTGLSNSDEFQRALFLSDCCGCIQCIPSDRFLAYESQDQKTAFKLLSAVVLSPLRDSEARLGIIHS